jgi:predicted metalloendopeptidase
VHNSLPLVQSLYGVSPFFKVTVESKSIDGNIITISEGELGLPNEEFYSLRNDHKVDPFNFSIGNHIIVFPIHRSS